MNGKNPTRKQKIIIQERRFNPANWVVIKNKTDELHIQNRNSGNVKILKL